MSDGLDPLILDLVEWVAREPRLYPDLIDAWRTSCPRLTVWEDAVDRGLLRREGVRLSETKIHVTEKGLSFLKSNGRVVSH